MLQVVGDILTSTAAESSSNADLSLENDACNSSSYISNLYESTNPCITDSGMNLIWSIFLLIVTSTAAIAALFLFVYVCFIFVDRCWSLDVPMMDRSFLVSQAGLSGLLVRERKVILKALFDQKSFEYGVYSMDPQRNENTIVKDEENALEDAVVDESVNCTRIQENVDADPVDESPNAEVHIAVDDGNHDKVCCICLNEYSPESKLVMGSSCVHVFHADCCLEWLQRHDHCPYCRNAIFTREELVRTAIEVLGQERACELKGARTDLTTVSRVDG